MANLQRRKVVEGAWPSRSRVMLEEFAESGSNGGENVGRTKCLTEGNLDELKRCLDHGFMFSYNEIPQLCNTLPALERCCSMSQRFLDEQQQSRTEDDAVAATDGETSNPPLVPIAIWRILRPGDNPDEVKARLRYWAQTVACTVKLCS